MPEWWERRETVLRAAKAADCTVAEREHALRLLDMWQGTERAVVYCEQCGASHRFAATQSRCPYVGEF